MSKMILKISIIALVLLLIGVVGGILTFRSSNEVVSVAKTKEITNPDIKALDVQIENASVEVIPTKGNTIKIELKGKKASSSKQELSTTVNGETLSVTLKDRQFKFFTLNVMEIPLSLKVYVPEKSYKSIKIECDNGKIKVTDLQVNDVYTKTDNGLITLENIKSTKTSVNSDNGMIVLKNVEGKLTGETNNGKITLKTKSLDRPIQLDSDNGIITVQTETEPTNVTFDVHVDNGTINILDKYRNAAVIGKGENLIKLTTNNGRITITK
ncbi:DUF4097 family beta strand repeat-containing protein [Rummeliibacillus sp. NPDC094406]|uniref:DUF4097 family beta strand repeat-containing protein n=1 Tax=Rummeliibacillus sp. NPDC094406 TaxID=3364511 RepID=UPI003808E4D1